MKRFLLAACAGVLTAVIASPSFAADMPRRSYKGPAPMYVAPFSWSGAYIGLNGGYGFGTSNWTNTFVVSDFDLRGALVGGTLGYNMQTGNWILGAEGDLAASWIKGSGCTTNCETRNSWLGTARGRIGYSWGHVMNYITGGAAFGDIKMSPASGSASESKTKVGYTFGTGVEYAFMGPWSAKLEYLYVDLGKATCSAATCGLSTDVKLKSSIVRAGVNYRF